MQYLKRRVLEPLHLKVARWDRDQAGNAFLPFGAYLTARQWFEFGLLIKGRGQWRGTRVISERAMAECFKGSRANASYGLTFWLAGSSRSAPGDMIRIAGFGGQLMYILPSQDLIVVRLADQSSFFKEARFLDLILQKPSAEDPLRDE